MPAIGLQFKVIYGDAHLMQIRVSAWNGTFGGTAEIYVGLDEIEEVARNLTGFPAAISDVREVMIGEFGSGSGGALSLRFSCTDSSGHTHVDLKIESNPLTTKELQTAACRLLIEAPAIDSFVRELGRMGAERAGQAFLQGTGKATR